MSISLLILYSRDCAVKIPRVEYLMIVTETQTHDRPWW